MRFRLTKRGCTLLENVGGSVIQSQSPLSERKFGSTYPGNYFLSISTFSHALA